MPVRGFRADTFQSNKRIRRRSPPPNLPPLGGGAGLPPPVGLGANRTSERMRLLPHWDATARGSGRPSPARGRGAGGEGQSAHPNAITPLDAHVFCPHLNPGKVRAQTLRRGMGQPGCPIPPPAGGFGRAAPSQEGCSFPSVCGAVAWTADVVQCSQPV